LIALIGVTVPRRLRADWKQEWEAELRHRELLLADWHLLNWRHKFDLFWRSTSAFWDALWLQPQRLEDEMFQDLKYAFRMLIKQPGFTVVAVLSLALGIGANTVIFSLLDAVLLKSLPVREPGELLVFGRGVDQGLTNAFPNRSWDLFSYPFYKEVQQRKDVFTDVTAFLSLNWGVHGTVGGSNGEPLQMDVHLVSGNYFSVLGVQPFIGRIIVEADDASPGVSGVAVISHRFWEQDLGGDPDVLGKNISISQTPYTIVGVAPREFFGTTVGEAPELWVPLAMEAELPPARWDGRNKKDHQSLYLIGRLKEGVSEQQATSAVNVLFKQSLHELAGPQPSPERLENIERAGIELNPAGTGISHLRQEFSLSLKILMAVVGVVLLIACGNVANLLLGRSAGRQKEFAVRLAVGAGRYRLVRQLLTESILLALIGGLAGVLLAWWGSHLIVVMASASSEALPLDVAPNARILGFTLLTSVMSAIIFGTAPALRAARIELNSALRGGKGAAQARSSTPLSKAMVISQVALSLVLLVAAGLFVRTLVNLQSLPTGFNQQNVMLFHTDSAATGFKGPQFISLLRGVEESVMAVPGVGAASFSFVVFNQGGWTSPVSIRGLDLPAGLGRIIRQNVVGQDYFTTMGIPILSGRSFGPQDTDKSQRVAVISETMAQRFFPDGSPVGRRFGTGGPENSERFEIIGVARDVKYMSLTEQQRPMAYYFHAQDPQPLDNFVVRFSGEPGTVVPLVREAIKQVNRNLPIDEVVTLSDHVGRSLVQQKLVARLASFFGLLALLLASIGLYGVLSYSVARRTGEIGIRMALGAGSRTVLWMVLREAMVLVVVGVVGGLAASWYATRMAQELLFNVEPNDIATLIGAAFSLIVIAIVASYLPARRASRVDPMIALRSE
jgi:predicted permease